MSDQQLTQCRGLTVPEVSKLWRVSEDKIRIWIKSGQLGAINTARVRCARPRYVILHHHLVEFEEGRKAGPPPKPARRRRAPADEIDYFP